MQNEKSYLSRLYLWILVTGFSLATLIMLQINADHLNYNLAITVMVSFVIMTMGTASLFVSAIAFKIRFVLQAEYPLAIAILLFWNIAIAILDHTRTDFSTRETITNRMASSYFSYTNIHIISWATLVFCFSLCSKVWTDFGSIGKEIGSRRFLMWIYLTLTSIYSGASMMELLGSSSYNSSWSGPCAEARNIMLCGGVECVLSLLTMVASYLLKEHQRIQLIIETAAAFGILLSICLSSLLYAFSSEKMETFCAITWPQFLFCAIIFVDCIFEKTYPKSLEKQAMETDPDDVTP